MELKHCHRLRTDQSVGPGCGSCRPAGPAIAGIPGRRAPVSVDLEAITRLRRPYQSATAAENGLCISVADQRGRDGTAAPRHPSGQAH